MVHDKQHLAAIERRHGELLEFVNSITMRKLSRPDFLLLSGACDDIADLIGTVRERANLPNEAPFWSAPNAGKAQE